MTQRVRTDGTLQPDADERLLAALALSPMDRPNPQPALPVSTEPERSPGDNILIAGWRAGLSAGAIAKQTGRTKNAIIGRAHRLMAIEVLGPRENPIITDGRTSVRVRARPPLPPSANTLPPLATPLVPHSHVRDDLVPRHTLPPLREAHMPFALDFRVSAPRPFPTPSRPLSGRVIECQWLEGDGPWIPCLERSEPGMVYCGPHCREAYPGYRPAKQENTNA